MSGHGEKLSRRREAALAALLTCTTLADAAATAKVSVATMRRWLQDPEFEAAFKELKRNMLAGAANHLRIHATEMVDVLADIARDKASPAPQRVAAAKSLLELLFAGVDVERSAHRSDDIEREYDEMRKRCE